MRRAIWLAALLLPLGGCYVEPAGPTYGYGPPGYPPGPPPTYDPYGVGYPGYSYNGGAPTYMDAGVAVPLVLFGGQWGYYDHDRHWHRAPDQVSHDLEGRRGGGGQFHSNGAPAGGGGQFHPSGAPRPDSGPQPRSGGFAGPAGFHPTDQAHAGAPPHPAAQATDPRQEGHEQRHDCAQGQHC
jgi:hypothetical protein